MIGTLARIAAAGASCALLAACISSGQVEGSTQARWVGRPADQFFATNGPAESMNGSSYIWRAGGLPYAGVFPVQCIAQIKVAPDQTIRAIKIMRDDLGINRVSRCAEVLR